MTRERIDCATCLNENCLIKKHISAGFMQDSIEGRSTIACKKGQQFIMEGSPVNGLYFLHKGKAKVLKTGIYGREQILRFVKEGEIMGHRGYGTSKKYAISALAMEDSILCHFTNERLYEMLQNIPALTYDLMLFYGEELDRSETKVKAFAQMTVREKVIDTLLYIHRRFGENKKGFLSLLLSRKEIADYAGTTNEQVIRTISALKKEKHIYTSGKRIGIGDVQSLKREISEHNYFLDS